MFNRPAFTCDDPAEIAAMLAARPLAHIVVHTADGLFSTPVPLLVDADLTRAVGHVARPNPLWQHAGDGIDALAIVPGADAYVTPSWYPAKADTGRVVPTWNYEVVQLHGRLVAHDDHEWVGDVVRRLTDHFEGSRPDPWSVDDAPAGYIGQMLAGIVGIELLIVEVSAKRKLSQNHPPEAAAAVAAGLAAGNLFERAVARRMGAAG